MWLLEPETALQLALQIFVFSLLTGIMLGIVATQVPVYVAVFMAMVLGGITLPVARNEVMRDRSYVVSVLVILVCNVAATCAAMAGAWFVFGRDFGGADWTAAFSAALFMNMVYIGLALERRRASEANRMAVENHMRLLQSQINPHFLSNTLANVSALIDSNPPAAQELLRELVSFLSDLVHYARHDTITLADALDSLETHLGIHRTRMGKRLVWSVDVSDDLHWQPLPPLMVLPLVENAVVHGVNALAEGGWVKLAASADKAAGRWTLSLYNSGMRNPASSAPGHGVAIANIRERLRLRYGSKASLELFWVDDQTHCARLTLPYVENARAAGNTSTRIRPHG